MRHVGFRVWICTSCGAEWHLRPPKRPARNNIGEPLCEPCRIYAGIAA